MGYSNQRKDIWMVFYLSLIIVAAAATAAAAAAAAILNVIEQKLVDFLCKFRPLECEYNLLVYLFYLSWCKCFATAAAAAAAASNSYGHSGNDHEEFFFVI